MDPTVKREREHQKWLELCAHLKRVGAVTDEDLKSRRRGHGTDGQQLLELIRQWGDLHHAIHSEEA